jgi:hypothetical protein
MKLYGDTSTNTGSIGIYDIETGELLNTINNVTYTIEETTDPIDPLIYSNFPEPEPIPDIVNMRIFFQTSSLKQQPYRMTMGSLYSNNAQVYYKSHTLAPGGIGGVCNYCLKSRKT